MRPKAPAFSQAIRSFLIYCESKNLSPQTVEWYRRRLDHLLRLLGDLPIEELTTTRIRELILYLRHEHRQYPNLPPEGKTLGLSPSTINCYIRALKTAFGFWVEEDLVVSDPMHKVSQLKTVKDAGAVLTASDLAAIIQANSGTGFHPCRNLALLLVLADTGIRIGELCRLSIRDLDWNQRSLSVLGKGSKIRSVPFGRATARALIRYTAWHPLAEDEYSPLFVTKSGLALPIRGTDRILKGMARRAGLTDKRISPHVLRRTFATLWISNGGDPFSLQRLLGHTTMEMVNRYVRLSTTDLQRTHATIGPVDRLRAIRRPE